MKKHKTTELAMQALNLVLDSTLAKSFDDDSTGATRATMVGNLVFVCVGGVSRKRQKAELLARLIDLGPSPSLAACSRVVLAFLTEMEKDCIAVSDRFTAGELAGASWYDDLAKARSLADKVAPPPFARVRIICFGLASSRLTGSLLQAQQRCAETLTAVVAHQDDWKTRLDLVPSRLSPAFASGSV